MFSSAFLSILLLPAALRAAATTNHSSYACNNSPSLCDKRYSEVTNLGAHDSPFVRNETTGYSTSGNQYYGSTVQLSAGVRLLTAQVQLGGDSGNELHVCHTSCDLLDAGTLASWLTEVRIWMDSNPHEVVTILLVNGANADASSLASQYTSAGITTSLAYTPSGSSTQSQTWPTLQSLITSGTRLLNFIASLDDNTAAPYLMNEWGYIFENNYDVSTPSGFSCEANRPSISTTQAISNGMMPLMNHFLYHTDGGSFIDIETPNSTYVTTTNAPSGGVGNLGSAADNCTQVYGRAPSFILVDFWNVGPAMETVDRLNSVTNPVGRRRITTANKAPTSSASLSMSMGNVMWGAGAAVVFALTM